MLTSSGDVLGHGAEDEEEVPDAHADLDAVGVAVAVVGVRVSLTVGWWGCWRRAWVGS